VHIDAPLQVIAERILKTANKGIDDALVLVVRCKGSEA